MYHALTFKNLEQLNFAFCSTFHQFILNKNLYNSCNILKHKIHMVFRANTRTCSHKNATSLWQKYAPIRRNKIITTPLEIFLNNSRTHISLDYRYNYCPVSWVCRIHQLHLCRGVRLPPMSVLDMTLNNLIVRFQWCWSFADCHRFQVHSGLEC